MELDYLVRDDDHYQTSFEDGQGPVGEWDHYQTRTAGTHGNALGVSICSSATAYEQTCCNYNLWNRGIRTNNYISNRCKYN